MHLNNIIFYIKRHIAFIFFFSVLIMFYLFIYRSLLLKTNFVYSDLNLFNSLEEAVNLMKTTWFPNYLGISSSAQTYHILFGLISTLFFGAPMSGQHSSGP